MRKIRWLVAICIFLVVVAGALALRRPPNDFPEIRPYVVAAEIDYIKAMPGERTNGMYGTPTAPGPAGCAHHVYWLKGITFDKLLPLLQARAAKKGLPVSQIKMEPYIYFEAVKNHAFRFNALRAMQGTAWTPFVFHRGEDPIGADFSVEDGTPLSDRDIVILRIRYLGMDPFAH